MLLDARDGVPPDLSTDVCIVGAGAAGIAMALELGRAGVRTIVLESGGDEFEEDVQDLYEGDLLGQQYARLDQTRLRYFGGSTNHWTGYCAPLTPVDLAGGGHRDPWPISYDELAAYYRPAGRVCGIQPYRGWELEEWATPLGMTTFGLDPGVIHETLFQLSKPLRFGPHYAPQLAAVTSVRVIRHASVIGLHAPGGGRVEEVRAVADLRQPFTVRAREVVLALGGLENARMLLASRDDDPEGIRPASELVGRGFHEHPHLGVALAVLADHDAIRLYGGPHTRPQAGGFVPALALSQEARRAEGLIGLSVTMDASEAARERSADRLAEDEHAGAVMAIGAGLGGPGDANTLTFYGRCEQLVDDASAVTLIRRRDALGMPRMALDWRVTEADRDALRDAVGLLGAELASAGIGRIRSYVARPTEEWTGPGWGHHPMGTTRMGTHPDDGVCDADGRVFGVENLWVTGSSLFCTGGFANPTLTVVALALRLAEQLAAEVG